MKPKVGLWIDHRKAIVVAVHLPAPVVVHRDPYGGNLENDRPVFQSQILRRKFEGTLQNRIQQ
jgi:hypothetical protein